MEKSHEDRLAEFLEAKLLEAKSIKEKCSVNISGKEFIIYPGVFNPNVFPVAHLSTELFMKLIETVKPKRVLEIGAGAGYNGVLACLSGIVEHCTCTDITQNAVHNIQENIDKYKLNHRMTATQSDVFDSINVGDDNNKKFDLIYFNSPFATSINKNSSDGFDEVDHTVFNPGYIALEKYVRTADQHLTLDSGRVFIGFSVDFGDYKLLCDIASKYGRVIEIFIEKTMIPKANAPPNKKSGIVFSIYELSRKNK